MPRFRVTQLARTADVDILRAACDGCDPARPCDEHARRASLWLVTAGAFELRDATGVHALDPTHALVMPANHAFSIRHPAGPDTCVAFHGPLVDRIVANRARLVPVAPAAVARLAALLRVASQHRRAVAIADARAVVARGRTAPSRAALGRSEPSDARAIAVPVVRSSPRLADDDAQGIDELAIAETLAEIASGVAEPPAPNGDLVDAVAHELRLRYADPTSLTELADRIGYSLFYTCRVFRATTGQTIHGFRRELRLRHALARILDGDEPLAAIAADIGFASQSHLTNLFRARFGITPGKVRAHGLAA